MSWAAVIVGGTALIGGIAQSQGAKKAANKAAAGGDAAIAEQRRQFDTLLGLTAPQRAIGNQALATLGSVYGYSPTANPFGNDLSASAGSPYQANFAAPNFSDTSFGRHTTRLLNPGSAAGQAIGIKPTSTVGKILDPLGGILGGIFGSKKGDEKRNMKAFLEAYPVTDLGNGMLALPDGTQFPADQLQHLAGTWYGATFAPDGDQEGWQAQYNAALGAIKANPINASRNAPPPSDPNGGNALAQTAPDYSAFFKSPDYQFRLNEGMNAVQNSAAAAGSLYSGNALRGIADYGQGLAASEFGNWFNRQGALAGIGQAATEQAGQGAIATGNNVSNLLMGQGNARASGIVDQTNALTGTLNQLAMLYGSGAFGGYGGYRPNSTAATGYGVPYGGRLA